MGLNKCKCSPKHRNKQKIGLKIQYKDKEIRLKALPPTPPRMEGSDMHRLIKRRTTSSRRVLESQTTTN